MAALSANSFRMSIRTKLPSINKPLKKPPPSISVRPKRTDNAGFDYLMPVGIDLATVLTTVSFILLGIDKNGDPQLLEDEGLPVKVKAQDVQIIEKWPGLEGESITVPSALAYTSDKILWGHEVSTKQYHTPRIDNVRGFKCALHESEETAVEIASLKVLAKQINKHPVDFTVDFLRPLRQHILKYLEDFYGDEIISQTRFQYKIGAPACYTYHELRTLRQVCLMAGFKEEEVSIACETEALLRALQSTGNFRPSFQRVHCVADAGGSTSDASSFQIWKDNKSLFATQMSVSHGIVAGGVLLNRHFADLAQQELESRGCPSQWVPTICDQIVEDFEKKFKLRFDGSQDYEPTSRWVISSLNTEEKRQVKSLGKIFHIPSRQIKVSVYLPVIRPIRSMIKESLDCLMAAGIATEDIVSGFLFLHKYR